MERNEFVEYLKAEGALGFAAGYVNCHRLPALVKRIAYGNSGFPWNLNPKVKYHYGRGVCPNAEFLHDHSVIMFEMCMFELPETDVNLILEAMHKVHKFCIMDA